MLAEPSAGQFLSYMKSYGGPNEEYGLYILPVSDEQGGHIIVGGTGSYGQAASNNSPNAFILRTDAVGTKLWSLSAGGSGYDFLNMVAETTDGWLAVGSVNYGGPNSDVLLMRISASGSLVWSRRIGTPERNEVGDHILALGNDEFIITGSRFITGGGTDGDVLVMKINGQGDVLWTSMIGSDRQDSPNAIKSTPDGGFLIAGTRTSLPIQQAFLLKLNADGGLEWERTWQAVQGSVTITRLVPSGDGGSILTGQGSSALQVMKLNETGNVVWSRAYQQGAYISGVSLGPFGDDGYLIVGSTSNPDYSMPRMMAMRIDELGEVVEARSYAGDLGNANGRSAIVEPEGGITMVGSLSTEGGDVLLVRTHAGDGGLGGLCNEQEETVTSTTPIEFAVVNGLYTALQPISPVTNALSWVVNPNSTETTHCTNVGLREQHGASPELTVFPNPTSGPVTLQWDVRDEQRLVELLDAAGRVVLLTTARGQVNVDLSKLDVGHYVVRASNGQGVLRTAVVVQ